MGTRRRTSSKKFSRNVACRLSPVSSTKGNFVSERVLAVRQRYVDDPNVIPPRVMTLNTLSAAPAANDFMMMFTGLYDDTVALGHQMNFVCDRNIAYVTGRHDDH